MDDNKLPVNLNIADRIYPLRIEIKEEEKLRKAAKLINDKVMLYRQKYSDKDNQDFIAMAALQFVTKVIELESKGDMTPLIESLSELDIEMRDYLNMQ
jgi:cell division protein ZapA (FtsZ GTPase activity inhibitor)